MKQIKNSEYEEFQKYGLSNSRELVKKKLCKIIYKNK